MRSRTLLSFVLLAPLLAAATPQFTARPQRRQDTGDGTSDGGDAADGAASSDAGDTGDTGASAAASPSGTASSGNGTTNIGTPLGGAGQGGGVPSACPNCEPTYESIISCLSDGTSASCSPLCSNYASTVSCISCLVSNGEPNVDQSAAQQVVWNLEASCSNLGSTVDTIEITAVPTATGPFTTPSGAGTLTSASGSIASTSHSGITIYDSVKIKQTGSVSTSPAVQPTTSTSGAALTKVTLPIFSTHLIGIGGLTFVALGLGSLAALW